MVKGESPPSSPSSHSRLSDGKSTPVGVVSSPLSSSRSPWCSTYKGTGRKSPASSSPSSDADDELITSKAKGKMRTSLLDSSDDERVQKSSAPKSSDSSSEDEVTPSRNRQKKCIRTQSSDSSDQEDLSDKERRNKLSGSGQKVKEAEAKVTDDSSDDGVNDADQVSKRKRPVDKEGGTSASPQQMSQTKNDSDTSDEEIDDPNPVRRSSDSGDSDQEVDGVVRDKKGRRRGGPDKGKKTSRASSKKALAAIYSEKNRMLRESAVELPYHKPKKPTLQEFLSRKKGTVELVKDLNTFNVKAEEGEKLLKEREQQVISFYKPEAEELDDEDDEDAKDRECMEPCPSNLPEEDSGILSGGNTTIINNTEDRSDETEKEEAPLGKDGDSERQQQAGNDKNDLPSEAVSDAKADESESLHLYLEESEQIIDEKREEKDGSDRSDPDQVNQRNDVSVQFARKLESLGNDGDKAMELALTERLHAKPVLGLGVTAGSFLVLNDEDVDAETMKRNELKARFVKHAQAGLPCATTTSDEKDVSLKIVRKDVDEEGKEQLKVEEVSYHSNPTKLFGSPSSSAWKKRMAWKKKLAADLLQKRRAAIAKRAEMTKMDNEDFEEEEEEILEEEDEIEEEDDYEEDESYDGEDEEEEVTEDVHVRERKKRVKNAFIDDEAEDDDEVSDDEMDGPNPVSRKPESDGDDNIDLKLDENSDNDETSELLSLDKDDLLPDVSMAKNTSISSPVVLSTKATPLSQETRTIPRWTPFDKRPEAKKKLGFDGLLDASDPQVGDLEDVVGLCSGQFEPERRSVTPDTQPMSGKDSEDIGCLSDVATTGLTSSNSKTNEGSKTTLVSSSDEDEPKPDKTRANKPLISSDDDGDSGGEEEKRLESDKQKDGVEEEDDDSEKEEVEYDSEENEIEKKPARPFRGFRGKHGLRREFVDQEAELSGSEGDVSGDEDERGLDRLDAEEGDFDDLDEDEVREKVGKIHYKQVLDQDRRDVKLLQEAFLEDGELHSDQARTRSFKWLGIDDSMELERRNSGDEQEEGAENVQSAEEKRRLDRLEREKWLQEAESKTMGDDEEESQLINMGQKVVRSMELRQAKRQQSRDEDSKKKENSFKEPSEPKLPWHLKSSAHRGSFLARSAEALDKLAHMTKDESRVGSGAARNSNKFVFGTVEADAEKAEDPDADNKKRKRSVLAVKTESNSNKKLQPEAKRTKMDRTLDDSSNDSVFCYMK